MLSQRDKILRDLISIPSYYPNKKGIEECRNYIEQFLKNINIPDSSAEVVDDNIIFSLNSQKPGQTIGILLHYDTVPPIENDFRSFSKDEEKIFGLGVTSAKGAIASILANLCKNCGKIVVNNKAKLIFSCDESIGSKRGTKNLVDNYAEKVEADIYWIPDCTSSYISIGSYHVFSLRAKFVGLSGHPAYTKIEDKENVVMAIPQIISSIKEEFNNLKKTYLDEISQPILSITGVKAFLQPNMIPGEAEVFLDVRLSPDSKGKVVIDNLLSILKKHPLLKDIHSEYYPGFVSQSTLKVARDFLDVIESVFDKKFDRKVEFGSHDGAYYGYKLKKPVIGFLPGGNNLHMTDEYLETASLDDIEKLFQKAVYDQ